ncbi:MAG: 1-(5-phosphoribosyl)-5-[(5-phosphoribosylamino)methylideneamino]imidazole-4-carboxamide isomerase [bacterium]
MIFEIIPAIDIINGECVRLSQGDYDRRTVYSNDPTEMARKWADRGAKRIHVVDLDGARSGEVKNFKTIKDMAQAVHIKIEVGGGIRDMETVEKLLEAGINRVILGTAALVDRDFLQEVLASYPSHVAVSIDAKDNLATLSGWLTSSKIDAFNFAKEMQKAGVSTLIYTDTAKDGMLDGPNFYNIKKMCDLVQIPVIAAGGISTYDDINKLIEMKNVSGCIIGKAIYEGRIELDQAIKLV